VGKYLVATIGTVALTKETLSAAVKAQYDVCLPVQECWDANSEQLLTLFHLH
jgi:hypothetical protein